MSAISVLLAPRDEALGAKIGEALTRRGYEARVVSGEPDADRLDADIDAAIVVWSGAAARLARLREQAREALHRGALIPVAVGGAPVPPGFETIPPVDLSGWAGDDADPRWRFVLDEIEIASTRGEVADADIWRREPASSLAAAPIADAPALDRPAAAAAYNDKPFEDQARGPAPSSPDIWSQDDPRYESWPEGHALVANGREAARRGFNPAATAIAGFSALAALSLALVVVAPRLLDQPSQAAQSADAGRPVADAGDDDPPATPTPPQRLSVLQPVRADDAPNDAPTGAPSVEPLASAEPEAAPALDQPGVEAPGLEAPLRIAGSNETEDDAPPAAAEDASPLAAVVEPTLEDIVVASAAAPGEPAAQSASGTAEDAGLPPAAENEALPDNLDALIAAALNEDEEARFAALPTSPERAPIEYEGDYFKECVACPDMAALPAGQFVMGAPPGEKAAAPSERPIRNVSVGRFAIATRETTFDQWEACVADGGCGGHRPYDLGWGRGDRPVIGVSFEDARAYARWLSEKTGQPYRLPSEAEWEYAARRGSVEPFQFGASVSPEDANFDARYPYGGRRAAFRGKTTPVASYAPNAFGLFDMHGNVWEWTRDCWTESHQGAPANAAPRTDGDCAKRTLKGGAWNTGGWRLRAAHRIGKPADGREFDNGFRVARDLE